jgi:hypothetical protein
MNAIKKGEPQTRPDKPTPYQRLDYEHYIRR